MVEDVPDISLTFAWFFGGDWDISVAMCHAYINNGSHHTIANLNTPHIIQIKSFLKNLNTYDMNDLTVLLIGRR